MAFQPAPAVAQAVMRHTATTGGAFAYANVLHFKTTAGVAFTETDLQELGSMLAAWDNGYAKVLRSTSYTLATIELRGLESQAAAYHVETVNLAGTAAGEQLPLNVAACVTLSTAFTGRSARGRLYVGGLAESQTQGNTLTAGVVTGINDAFAALLNLLTTDGRYEWVVLSRQENGVPRTNALPYVITGASLRDSVIDTQKRRIDKFK